MVKDNRILLAEFVLKYSIYLHQYLATCLYKKKILQNNNKENDISVSGIDLK